MSENLTPRLLVTGASGNLGSKVVELLAGSGTKNLVAASREPGGLAAWAEQGIETRRADFDDPAGLAKAFEGIDRLLIISTDAIGQPGVRRRQHLAAVEAAVAADVGQIVYTSMPKPEPGSLIPFAPDHFDTEQAIEASGVPFTILRVNWYMENLHLSLPSVLASGKWFSAAGDGRVGHVAREDVARVAAAALAGEGPGKGRYDITGPEALSTAEIAAIAGEVFDRDIDVVPVSDDALAEGLTAAGVPGELVPLLVAFDANTRAGRVDIVSDGVAQFTGKSPQSLRDFLSANRTAFTAAA